jgi:hypothetical protein
VVRSQQLVDDDLLEALALELAYDATIESDEQAARRVLRRQVAKLERDLQACVISSFGHVRVDARVRAAGGPRLLGIGELEVLRDELAEKLRHVRADLARGGADQASSRLALERMRRDPGAHRRLRIPAADLGEPGCGDWHVRPRLGLIGMLVGWWEVKLSSGCPLVNGGHPCPHGFTSSR